MFEESTSLLQLVRCCENDAFLALQVLRMPPTPSLSACHTNNGLPCRSSRSK